MTPQEPVQGRSRRLPDCSESPSRAWSWRPWGPHRQEAPGPIVLPRTSPCSQTWPQWICWAPGSRVKRSSPSQWEGGRQVSSQREGKRQLSIQREGRMQLSRQSVLLNDWLELGHVLGITQTQDIRGPTNTLHQTQRHDQPSARSPDRRRQHRLCRRKLPPGPRPSRAGGGSSSLPPGSLSPSCPWRRSRRRPPALPHLPSLTG